MLTAKQRVDAYRQRKQAAMLCIEGGCWEPSPDAERCTRHSATHAARTRRWRKEDSADEPEAA